MEEITAAPCFKVENDDVLRKKIGLLNFIKSCKQAGYDKLLEKHSLEVWFPKVDASDSLEDIQLAVESFQEVFDSVAEEEEFSKFVEAVKICANAPVELPKTRDSPTLQFKSSIDSYFFCDDQDLGVERLRRACKEGLMGEYGKAVNNMGVMYVEMKKRTEELKKLAAERMALAEEARKKIEESDLQRSMKGERAAAHVEDLIHSVLSARTDIELLKRNLPGYSIGQGFSQLGSNRYDFMKASIFPYDGPSGDTRFF